MSVDHHYVKTENICLIDWSYENECKVQSCWLSSNADQPPLNKFMMISA
jgi:hypothetical protein